MSDQGPTVFNGRYELLRHIARGGMADVYLARDELLDREVALKVLFPEFANDPSFVERFRREAQAAANLNHPNIVGVYDWGQERGTYYIVMEHVPGRSMADVLRSSGPLQPDRAAEIAADVAGALAIAHQAGLVHRDVKLGNILVSDSGDVKVADFGIATALAGGTDAGLTQHGSVMGTATYFSPEQAQGKQVDGRSDLYSLGVVLYEMLAGVPPFQAETPVAVAYKHVQEKPQSLLDRDIAVEGALNAITMKLLAKNPANRYPSADDLRSDLQRYLDGAREVPGATATAAAGAGVAVASASPADPTVATPPDATTALPAQSAASLPATIPAAQPAPVLANPGALAAGYSQGGYYYDDPEPPRRDDWKRTVGLLFGLGILIFILGFLTIAFIDQLGLRDDDGDDTPEEVGELIAVPVLTGMSADEAETELLKLNLMVEFDRRNNETVEINQVYDQLPPAGQKIDEGSVVTLIVSAGIPDQVPNVIGMEQQEALDTLDAAGYATEIVPEADVRELGTVTKQTPGATTELAPGETVTITVSTGPETVSIPDLEGATLNTAYGALFADGFQVVEPNEAEASEEIEAGLVIRTEPAAGSLVDKGSWVTIVESTGFPTVPVPSVVDLLFDTAEQTLLGAGLVVEIEFVEVPIGSASVGRVTSQFPVAFEEVDLDTVVTITIGEAAPEPATTTTTTTTTTVAPTTTSAAP